MRLKLCVSVTALGALCLGSAALAQGSAEAGQAKAATCVACHGVDGHSVNPEWPNLAGQHESYVERQLELFRSGARQNVLMTPMAMGLSDQDIADLAAYYAAQQVKGLEADPAKVALGEAIYRGGVPAANVPACIACHGPTGAGNPTAAYPLLKGQHATYTAAQLRAYRSGERDSDQNQIMRNASAGMTDEQIDAVASYIQGLR
ncbi:MAG TPA: c-type cytochrome [Steroidobacteraceae bacterium]|nr:c-type cytochrome [Steroidobacteraceae bacterium]